MLRLLSAFLLSLLLFLANPFDVVIAQSVKVEVETGPEFKSDDESRIRSCFSNAFENKFPFAAIGNLPDGGVVCPQVSFFGSNHEFCWLVDIWHVIEPGVMIYYLIQIIIHL